MEIYLGMCGESTDYLYSQENVGSESTMTAIDDIQCASSAASSVLRPRDLLPYDAVDGDRNWRPARMKQLA